MNQGLSFSNQRAVCLDLLGAAADRPGGFFRAPGSVLIQGQRFPKRSSWLGNVASRFRPQDGYPG